MLSFTKASPLGGCFEPFISIFFFFGCAHQRAEVPGPGMAPTPQQGPEPQCLLGHQGTRVFKKKKKSCFFRAVKLLPRYHAIGSPSSCAFVQTRDRRASRASPGWWGARAPGDNDSDEACQGQQGTPPRRGMLIARGGCVHREGMWGGPSICLSILL